MRRKILGLLLLIFIMYSFGTIAVSADEETTSEETTVAEVVEETTTVAETTEVAKAKKKIKVQPVYAKKKVKVNSKVKLKKVLKLNKKQIKKYNFTSKKENVATVDNKGVVVGVKEGSTTIIVRAKSDDTLIAKVKIKVKNRFSDSSLRLMSAIICSEAENQSFAGKKAVGVVVMNRLNSSYFPNTLTKVIYQSGQFTPARNGSLNRSLSRYDNGSLDSSCIEAAKEALNGDTTVSLSTGTIDMASYLFFSRYISGCRLQIGAHQFK